MNTATIGGATITYNGAIPSIGAVSLKANATILPNVKTRVDMSHQYSLGTMTGVQTIFVDLADAKHDIYIHTIDTDQTIKAYAGTQGYYPILATSNMKFDVWSNAKEEINNVPVYFLNFPVALGVWSQPKKIIDDGGNGNGGNEGGTASGLVSDFLGGGSLVEMGYVEIPFSIWEGEPTPPLVTVEPSDDEYFPDNTTAGLKSGNMYQFDGVVSLRKSTGEEVTTAMLDRIDFEIGFFRNFNGNPHEFRSVRLVNLAYDAFDWDGNKMISAHFTGALFVSKSDRDDEGNVIEDHASRQLVLKVNHTDDTIDFCEIEMNIFKMGE